MDPKTFCILSYVGTDIDMNGYLVPCCNYEWHDSTVKKWHVRQYREWKTHGLEELRQDLNNGRRHANCSKCWHHEDHGIYSYRQAWNDHYHSMIERREFLNDVTTKLLHIEFDSYCNIKCIMCHPANSSSLAAEVHRNNDAYSKFFQPILANDRWYETAEWRALKEELLPQVDYIMFTGGEPLISPHVMDFIENLPDRSRIGLRVTTNATTATPRMLEMFREFRSVDIGISLEGVGAHNDLLRYGSRWDSVHNNIIKFHQLKNHEWRGINIGHVLTHTSAWALPDLMKYCIINDVNVQINPLFGQDWLHSRGMSPVLRSQFTENMLELKSLLTASHSKNFERQIDGAVDTVNSHDYDAACEEKFWEFVDMLDRIRGTNFRDVVSKRIDIDTFTLV